MATLLRTLPHGIVDAARIDERERKKLWRGIQAIVERLNGLAVELDLIALPPLMYNPADPATFAESIGNKLLLQDPFPLARLGERAFYGSGIYALFYHGSFDAYVPIRRTGTPIYAGKADPAEKDARTPQEQGTRLWARLREHADSIKEARNLDINDFDCRYLVVGSGWQVAAEAHLIALFKPVWNKEMKVCQGLGKHGDASETRRNLRSAWDSLHPGRPWAEDAESNRRSVDQIKADIADHYRRFPPRH